MLLRKASMLLALILGVALMVPEGIADARGGRGGRSSFSSSRSSRSSSSRSTRSSPSRSSSSRSSSSRSSGGSSWGKSKASSKPAARKATAADKALAAKAKKNGTWFKSKADAQKAFKSKYATKYTSKYASKPATRPSHIPTSTTVGGKSYNVTYNVNHGGYGYMGPLGAWIVYDAMADTIMMNRLMRNQGYYAPGMNSGAVVVTGPSFGMIFLSIIRGLFVVGIIVFIIRRA